MHDWLKQIESEQPRPMAYSRFLAHRQERLEQKPWGWWAAVLGVMILGFWLGQNWNKPKQQSNDSLQTEVDGVVYLLAQDLPPKEAFQLNDWP